MKFPSTLSHIILKGAYILLVCKRVNGHTAKHYGFWIQALLKITKPNIKFSDICRFEKNTLRHQFILQAPRADPLRLCGFNV